MMSEQVAHFIDLDRKARYLLPPSMEDWLPEGHLARFDEWVELATTV